MPPERSFMGFTSLKRGQTKTGPSIGTSPTLCQSSGTREILFWKQRLGPLTFGANRRLSLIVYPHNPMSLVNCECYYAHYNTIENNNFIRAAFSSVLMPLRDYLNAATRLAHPCLQAWALAAHPTPCSPPGTCTSPLSPRRGGAQCQLR